MRQLATVQTIKSLEKIEGKDRILYASFENVGFRVIVSSDTKVGEKVIYCECDSVLPVRPEFEFLRKRCYSDKWNGFRIRNMKMGGLYSEGLVLPTSILQINTSRIADGLDLTKALGIIKYDPELLEENNNAVAKKPRSRWMSFVYRSRILSKIYSYFKSSDRYEWPRWASKSDETRAQNLGYIFEKYQGQHFYATEKLDGQSCLYAIYKKRFYVCSRNLCLKDPKKGGSKNNYWEYAHANNMEEVLKKLRKEIGQDFYIQGELCGPGIQQNKYGFETRQFFVFNMYLIESKTYVYYRKVMELCNSAGIKTVPLLKVFDWDFKNMDELLKFADGYSCYGNEVLREGVVLRSCVIEPPDRGQSNMRSLKVISPSFDLKWN